MQIQFLAEEIAKVSDIYCNKFSISRDSDWYILKLQEELGELIQAYLMKEGRARNKGKNQDELDEDFKLEMADVLAHVLLLAKSQSVDIEKAIQRKWLEWSSNPTPQ